MFNFSVLIIGAMLFIAYVNGANDNFKGVATLFGSGAADYRQALGWTTITTLAGSLTAVFLATRLISIFQGNGLVPPSLAESEPFLTAVILGAALTVFLAAVILTLLVFPFFLKALRFAGLNKENCVCIGSQVVPAPLTPEGCVMSRSPTALAVLVDSQAACIQSLSGSFLGVNAQKLTDAGHFVSAGAVSFARGLNDTPKIVALGLVVRSK
jgi:PiT family inorganic phosphate transporter